MIYYRIDAFIIGVVIVLAIFLGLTFVADAHQAQSGWQYPLSCCSERDCAEIPTSHVMISAEGYTVTLTPETHDFLDKTEVYFLKHDDTRIKPSPDGVFHACVATVKHHVTGERRFICFFRPGLIG